MLWYLPIELLVDSAWGSTVWSHSSWAGIRQTLCGPGKQESLYSHGMAWLCLLTSPFLQPLFKDKTQPKGTNRSDFLYHFPLNLPFMERDLHSFGPLLHQALPLPVANDLLRPLARPSRHILQLSLRSALRTGSLFLCVPKGFWWWTHSVNSESLITDSLFCTGSSLSLQSHNTYIIFLWCLLCLHRWLADW
jgi:hypothetical protein